MMHKITTIFALAMSLLLPGAVWAHGSHSVGNPAPLSSAEHSLVHLGEWALMIIAGLLVFGFAVRALKKRL